MNKDSSKVITFSSFTMGFITFIVFLILKLTHTWDVNWFWVWFPLWIPAAIFLSFIIISVLIGIILILIKRSK